MADHSEPLPPEAIDALQRGKKIEAIKLVREAFKLDLKDAKDRVDAYVENDPALRQKLASTSAESMRSLIRWVIIIAVGVLGYFFFVAA